MCLHFAYLQSVFFYLVKSCFIHVFEFFSNWNNTPSHFHYLNYLDSIYKLGSFGNDGEVEGFCQNIRPNELLLVSETRCSVPGGFYLVPNITTYPLLLASSRDGVI